jgi:SAM-dependent methyltransferase
MTANTETRALRRQVFNHPWPLDAEMTAVCTHTQFHEFLANPAAQNLYVYLSRFVQAYAERKLGQPLADLKVLDWGCGKGQVTKLLHDLEPSCIQCCDRREERGDSAFGQNTPLLRMIGIHPTALEHDYLLPYADSAFDVVLSVGVLEHVPDDRASLKEINRVLKPGGLFFCFFLPATYSWTQKIERMRGVFYHDRLYNRQVVSRLVPGFGFRLLDVWYRQLFPKNSIRYPAYRLWERIDQAITEYTPLRHLATNVEFVAQKV